MTVEHDEADALLKDVAGAERRTREFLVYARAGDYMILWGVLWALGFALGDRLRPHTGIFWLALDAVGIVGTGIITYRVSRCARPGVSRFAFVRPMIAILTLVAFGNFWAELTHFTGRQETAFWPSFCGVLLFCFGLWAGRTLSIGAALIVGLTLAGYFWAGPWFDVWLAVTCGGALILGGVWLRR